MSEPVGLVVGIDAAAQAANTGIAIYQVGYEPFEIVGVLSELTPTKVAEHLLKVSTESDLLFAVDAPLGWPAAYRNEFCSHVAGSPLAPSADELFMRATDMAVKENVGIRPLSIGADKIARASHSVLNLIATLSEATKRESKLVWSPHDMSPIRLVEVYPAATAKLLSGEALPPKKRRDEYQDALLKCLRQIGLEWESLPANQNALDAMMCVGCGVRFIRGEAEPPSQDQMSLAVTEGWIWV